jgi:hypothetical protein
MYCTVIRTLALRSATECDGLRLGVLHHDGGNPWSLICQRW